MRAREAAAVAVCAGFVAWLPVDSGQLVLYVLAAVGLADVARRLWRWLEQLDGDDLADLRGRDDLDTIARHARRMTSLDVRSRPDRKQQQR